MLNLMSNIGGAVGIAVVNTWLQDDTRIQVARLGESLGEAGRHAPEVVAQLAERIGHVTSDAARAVLQAQSELAHLVSRHALTLSFNEVFRQMAWLFIAALIMVPFCRPVRAVNPVPDAH